MAAVLTPGADQEFALIGHLGVGRPDLRSRDHVLVAVPDGPGAERGQVASGVGLTEALAPDLLALEDAREVALALLRGALGDDRLPRMEEPDEIDADIGGMGPCQLLVEDELLHGRGTAAAPSTGQSTPA